MKIIFHLIIQELAAVFLYLELFEKKERHSSKRQRNIQNKSNMKTFTKQE